MLSVSDAVVETLAANLHTLYRLCLFLSSLQPVCALTLVSGYSEVFLSPSLSRGKFSRGTILDWQKFSKGSEDS